MASFWHLVSLDQETILGLLRVRPARLESGMCLSASHKYLVLSRCRGQYYGIAAAVGKIGAFAGSYALDAIQKAAGDDKIAAGRNPFFVASSLAFLAAGLVLLLPHIGQDTIDQEDVRFKEYLLANGYDTSKMGMEDASTASSEVVKGERTKA